MATMGSLRRENRATGEPPSGKRIDTSEAGRVMYERLNLTRESLKPRCGWHRIASDSEGDSMSSVINRGAD